MSTFLFSLISFVFKAFDSSIRDVYYFGRECLDLLQGSGGGDYSPAFLKQYYYGQFETKSLPGPPPLIRSSQKKCKCDI